jgi:hypothetical protein
MLPRAASDCSHHWIIRSPPTEIAGFGLHPDGKRFAASVADWPADIWMLEGFEPSVDK